MPEGVVSYRFLSLVGEGGFGRVYRARMETGDGFQKEVAIKILSEEAPHRSLLARFHDEAKILGLIRDRAIVGVDPPVQISGRWAVVMEFVDGASCGELINAEPMPPGVAVEVVMEIARALHNAYHMLGPEGQPLRLLHRDVKPENIQITPAGEVRLLDFGIAKADFAAREFHTRASFGGTPGYIAPERSHGFELPVGDVYSLGVVLHELVTGVRPRYTPTVHLDGAASELATELDVHPKLLADPAIAETLRLAGWMRAETPEDRPSARQVEEACRRLRLTLPPPYLRDWAEEKVPHRIELAPDHMVGQLLNTTVSTMLTGPNTGGAQAPTHVSQPTLPLGVTQGSLPPVTYAPPPEPPRDGRLALGALLGGSAALVALLGITAVALAVLGVYLMVVRPNDGVITAPVPSPVSPDPAPIAAPAPVDAAPAPQPEAPDPIGGPSVAPQPAPQPVTVIDVPVEPAPAPAPAPAPIQPQPQPQPQLTAPQPSTLPSRPTGRVIVRTIPSGGTVTENGQTLTPSGLGYELTVGRHMLVLVAKNGERSRPTPVVVTASDPVEICYSFDTNSACSAAP